MGASDSDNTRSTSLNRPVLDRLQRYMQERKISSSSHYADALSELSEDQVLHSTKQQFRDESLSLPRASSPAYDLRRDLSHIDEDNVSEDSLDIEVGRGGARIAKNTPSRPSRPMGTSDIMMDMINPTPPHSGSKTKRTAAEPSNLRKELFNRRTSFKQATDKENTPIASRTFRQSNQTQRGTPKPTANSTRDSFLIPDVDGISGIINGTMTNTPGASRSARVNPSNRRSGQNYHQVAGVGLTDDAKHLIVQLEQVADALAKEKRIVVEKDLQIEEYEHEVSRLRAEVEAAHKARSDSALGSSEDEGRIPLRTRLQMELTRLRATVLRQQAEIKQKDREIQSLQRTIDRMKDSRGTIGDGAMTAQIRALEAENTHLRENVDDLQLMNDELQAQLDETRDAHDEQTQQWSQKEMDLNKRFAEAEQVIAENQDLRQRLEHVKQQYESEVNQIRTEGERRRKEEQQAKKRYTELQNENERLQAELIATRSRRETRSFSQAQPGDISAQLQINHNLREYNEELRTEIERLKVEVTADSRKRVETRVTESNKRPRSTSKSRSKAAKSTRQPTIELEAELEAEQDDVSDGESTTDLSDALLAQSAIRPSSAKSSKKVQPDTYLDALPLETERSIRRRMELERFGKSHRRAVSASQAAPAIARKSSMKKTDMGDIIENITSQSTRSRAAKLDNEFISGANQQDTQQSHHSISIRRKLGTGQDMTSEFILPDFTLPAARILHPKIDSITNATTPHDPARCTVCYRIIHPSAPVASTAIPVAVPISQTEQDIDATSRPSEDPSKALYRVIKQIADEIVHLKMDLLASTNRLKELDGSKASREHRELHTKIDVLNRSLANKNAQLYSLYDALEGLHPGTVEHMVHQHDEEADLTADATEEVQAVLAEIKANRRVTIQSPAALDRTGSRRATVGDWESEDSEEDDAPWEGLSVTTQSMKLDRE
jgi:myosin heavy subunit